MLRADLVADPRAARRLCHVGGSALLADRLRPDERGRTRGLADSSVGAASARGALLSGVLFTRLGHAGTAWLAGVAAMAKVPFVLVTRRECRRPGSGRRVRSAPGPGIRAPGVSP